MRSMSRGQAQSRSAFARPAAPIRRRPSGPAAISRSSAAAMAPGSPPGATIPGSPSSTTARTPGQPLAVAPRPPPPPGPGAARAPARGRSGPGLAAGRDDPRLAVVDDGADAGVVAGDRRQPAGHRLDEDDPERLRGLGREHERVGGAEDLRQ